MTSSFSVLECLAIMMLPTLFPPKWTGLRFFVFLIWLVSVSATCLLLFTGGFLLRRQVLDEKSACLEENNCNTTPALFSKAIIVIVDALKHEFVLYNETNKDPEHFENKLPAINRLVSSGKGKVFKFMADPPTTTMQRLKGLSTGSLPTFIDVSSNFGSYEIGEDNLIDQLVMQNKKIVFMGDDTWMGLFPDRFNASFPFPSFDVWDLDTVDKGVNSKIYDMVKESDKWDVLIGHYLGVDHAGHKFGPRHPEMARKLSETDATIAKLAEMLPSDCVMFVMGDHGMTTSGDHGGDSPDELEAAMFVYSKQFDLKDKNISTKDSVDQVDFVPTFSLLMGIPIPFSNLGRVIPDLMQVRQSKQEKFSDLQLLKYIKTNVEQVMRYLFSYKRHGGNLPQKQYEKLKNEHKNFLDEQARPMSSERIEKLIVSGLDLLKKSKSMCQSVWVEFDLNLMGFGLSLLFIQLCLLCVLVSAPKTRLISNIVNARFVTNLFLSLMSGIGLAAFFVFGIGFGGNRSLEAILGIGASFSVMTFGFSLLWKLRNSLYEIFFGEVSVKCKIHLLVILISSAVLFSNSFVVEESTVLNFCVVTLLFTYVWDLRSNNPAAKETRVPIAITLLVVGIIRLSNVYFRCREEQASYCYPSDFHKPIATLPKDASFKTYKNWRFSTTFISAFLVVYLPHHWLKSCGNINGLSLPVSVSSYVPANIFICMVCYWAMQGHEVGAKLVPWQQNILAQASFGLAAFVILICLLMPKLLYLEHQKGGREIPNLYDGVTSYFQFVRTNWRYFTLNTGRRKVTVYGLGTALSAPLLAITLQILLISMLLLGDGLCPSMFLALLSMAAFLYVSTLSRLKDKASQHLIDLFSVPWTSVMGWFLLECLFFYATGHQPTFPTIQWNAAFVGFSGSSYGESSSNIFMSYVLPAVMIGWNTYAARIVFGISLPLLLVAPFTLWLRMPSVRKSLATMNDSGDKNNKYFDVDKGEVILLERADETKSQLMNLCCKYLLLQTFRLLGTMVAAAVLRRHLMVWKIFAPRFIFEGVGFLVSGAFVLLGYLFMLRITNALLSYYRLLEKDK